jgi:uncharacterized RDD family membrane protein YckC
MNDHPPAGFFRIIGSIFYDGLLLGAVLFFASFVFLLIPDELQHKPYMEMLKVSWYILVSYAYFTGFWLKGHQTPGMKSWKIQLVRTDGSLPEIGQLSLRFLSAILSWVTLGLGFIWILVDSNKCSLHDHLSATRLVHIK